MKKGLIISTILSTVCLAIAVVMILNTKGEIPIHWNINGQIDGYGSPWTMLIFPITSILVTILLYFVPKIDPKSDNIKKSGPLLPLLMVIISSLMLGIEIILAMAIKGSDINILNYFISIFLGIVFIVIGYYSPRIKHNYMMGIRTPWTLSSEKVWNKTHEAAKNWLILAGASFIVGMILPVPINIIIPLIITIIVVIGITIYSYYVFDEERNNKKK